MAVVRFSAVRHAIYAPRLDGEFGHHAYLPDQYAGALGSTEPDVLAELRAQMAAHLAAVLPVVVPDLDAERPLVLLVHGFGFDPTEPLTINRHQTYNPHGRVYHDVRLPHRQEKSSRCMGWLRGFGLGETEDRGQQGLALGWGWYSDPNFIASLVQFGAQHYAEALLYARQSALACAELLDMVARHYPGRPIDVVAHGLGAQVVMDMLSLLEAKSPAVGAAQLGRIVLYGGMVSQAQARAAFSGLAKHGAAPEVYNLTSRHDNILQWVAELAAQLSGADAAAPAAAMLGRDGWPGQEQPASWIDLQLDRPALIEWVAQHKGLNVSGHDPADSWDHWYFMANRNNMELCRRILRRAQGMAVAELREAGVPEGVPGSRQPWQYQGRRSWELGSSWAYERMRSWASQTAQSKA